MNSMEKQQKQKDKMPFKDFPVAMAYVPWQEWNHVYEIEKGFEIGTIFPELNKPFTGCKC